VSATDLVYLSTAGLLGLAVLLVGIVARIEGRRPPLRTPIDIVREVAARKASPDCPAFGVDTDCKAAPAIAPAPRSYWR
jgi:hypothetical protein